MEIKRKTKKQGQGTILRNAFMTGISYMIPVIVGGGVLQAIAKAMGGYDIGSYMDTIDTLAKVIFLIGSSLMDFSIPFIAGYTAYAMADKPGLAPGFAMGTLAVSLKTGFLGGLIGGVIVGYLVLAIRKINVPKTLQGIMPIMIYPVFVTLIAGLIMYYVLGGPIAWFMQGLTNMLVSLNTGSKFVLGAVIGAMMCIDNGGPFGKTAATFTNGLNADGFFIPTSAKMCAGMTSPLGIALSTVLARKKFTKAERDEAKTMVILSMCYIQECVIPFQLKDPVRVTVCSMIGGAITGGLCMVTGLESPAVHGGAFVIPMTSSPLMFIGLWFLGSAITGTLYAIVRRPLPDDYDESMDVSMSII